MEEYPRTQADVEAEEKTRLANWELDKSMPLHKVNPEAAKALMSDDYRIQSIGNTALPEATRPVTVVGVSPNNPAELIK